MGVLSVQRGCPGPSAELAHGGGRGLEDKGSPKVKLCLSSSVTLGKLMWFSELLVVKGEDVSALGVVGPITEHT